MKKHFVSVFLVCTGLLQLWLLYRVLVPSPAPSQWGRIDERFFSFEYVLVSLLTAIMICARRPSLQRWLLYAALAVLLVTAAELVYFSDYYENQGQLGWSVDMDGENPITYNERTGNEPPNIKVLYAVAGYNILLAAFVRWQKRRD